MPDSSPRPPVIRFGVFEVDLRSGELRKSGVKIKLQEQPLQILAMLLEHPGEVVTREELEKRLWRADTFVDFEHSLATAVKKLREALRDSADNPRFIETLPKRGYRFIAPVDVGAGLKPTPTSPAVRWIAIAAAGVVALAVAVVFALNIGHLRDRLVSLLTGPPKIESIAVLPLENLSRDPEQEYFSDGMTDALITDLGKISALRVISRTSVMRYKQTKKPLPEIAKELNVDAVVEGTVQRSGNRVRITANLLHAPTDRHLWAESYERDLRDILALQSEIARQVAHEVRVKLSPQEQTRLVTARPVNPAAHEAYLKGIYHAYRPTQGESPFKTTLEYLQKAIVIDPTYAPPYAALAGTHISMAWTRHMSPGEAFLKARIAAGKALELDEGLSEAHAALGLVKYSFEWDWAGAERELRRALDLNPSSQIAHTNHAQYLTLVGRFDEAIEERQRAFELDPTSRFWFGWTYVFARRYDDAILEFKKEVDAGNVDVQWWLPIIYAAKGMASEALAECENLKKLRPGPDAKEACSFAHLAAGRRGEAKKEFMESQQGRPYVDPWVQAEFNVAMGENDKAMWWLMKAYEERSSNLCLLKVASELDPLRSDPRFQDLLRRMNFPP